jgi:hypothetical protein
MTEPTTHQRLAAGYSAPGEFQQKKAARKAGAHKPGHDAEADRLTSTVGDALPPSVRMALGYHESAREAARNLDNQEQ